MLRYPFALPGTPTELTGRESIRAHFAAVATGGRALLDMAGVEAVVRETDDPEVMIAEVEHHGYLRGSGGRYRFRAIGVIRVRAEEIVSYDDYMNPIAQAELLGRAPDLVAALTTGPAPTTT